MVEMMEPGGETLGLRPLEPDWEPVEESLRFDAIRAERLDPAATPPQARVVPVWHSSRGEPYVTAFDARLGLNDGSVRVGLDYFKDAAVRVSSEFVQRGELQTGDTFTYRIVAVPEQATDSVSAADANRFEASLQATTVLPGAFAIDDRRMADTFDGAAVLGEEVAGDLPVAIDPALLEEMYAIARAAGPREVGGVLLGRLFRDPQSREMFAAVSTQIPALEAKGELTHLEFTPETWAGIADLIRMRGNDEIALGWWHLHPVHRWEPCSRCPESRRRVCPRAQGFFSAEDCLLHRAVFPRAYTVAVVVSSISETEHHVAGFGWRGGRIHSRALHVIGRASNDDDNEEENRHGS